MSSLMHKYRYKWGLRIYFSVVFKRIRYPIVNCTNMVLSNIKH